MEVPDFSRVLVVDDEEPMRHMLQLLLSREGYEVDTVASGEAAVERLGSDEAPDVDVVLSDVRMPGMGGLGLVEWAAAERPELTVIVMSAFGSIELAVDAMHRGAYDYISKPFKQDEVVLALRKAQERQRLRRENSALRARLRERVADAERLGALLIHSASMRRMARTVRKVAAFKTSVLLLGESGVGKELASRALHDESPRRDGPFVAVNCGAIPETLLESELFGHRKGAFTDASADKRGLFEEADHGTLFLDEIGELPPPLQVKLLRALQEGEVRRVGDNHPLTVDVRVVAATSRDLGQMVEDGEFREDLYYRLAVVSCELPPLRERRGDIPMLIELFSRRLPAGLWRAPEPEAMARLVGHDWPGNVRELRNVVERSAYLSPDGVIDLMASGGPRRGGERTVSFDPTLTFREQKERAVEAFEEAYLHWLLERAGGNISRGAREADMDRKHLHKLLRRYGIDAKQYAKK